VHDYGALLKIAKYQDCLHALQGLLVVFLTLAPTGLYAKAVSLYLILLQHWKTTFPQVSKIWENNLAAFIEEDGELSFSVLSRTVLADSSKSSFTTLNKAYSGQYMYRQAMSELQTDLDCFTRTSNLHVILHSTSDEVKQLSQFLDNHFQSIMQDGLSIYVPMTKGSFCYENQASMTANSQIIFLSDVSLQSDPQLALSIKQLEPPSLQLSLDQLLNTVENTLLDHNVSGCTVNYVLNPVELQSESDVSMSEEEYNVI
jgi:hypothetical protein